MTGWRETGAGGSRETAGVGPGEHRASPARRLVWLASLAILVAAAILVPLPLVELVPGPALDVPSHLRVEGQSGKVSGKLLLTSVLLSQPSAVGVLDAWLRSHREILRAEQLFCGSDERDYVRIQRELFDESVRVAAAAGLRRAGIPVGVSGGGARVLCVAPRSPAEGHLQVGDVITEVDGRPVQVAPDVVSAVGEAAAQRRSVTLTISRGNETSQVELRPRQIRGADLQLRSLARIDLPFPVRFDDRDLGGESAGLMIALSVYDIVDPVDLARGRVIAGTGTITAAGDVGPIGGIEEKVVGAERAGASVFLAPASQAIEARRAARQLQVVSVGRFDDAVRALSAR